MTERVKIVMAKLYRDSTELSVDQLPYTAEFDRLYSSFRSKTGVEMTKNQFWRELTCLRKRGSLVRKQRA